MKFFSRLAVSLFMATLLSACFLPDSFESTVEINADGTFLFQYDGTLIFMRGKVEAQRKGELSEKTDRLIKDIEEDFRKDKDFKEVEYLGDSKFRVVYEKAGSLDTPFYFLSQRNKLLSIVSEDSGRVVVQGMMLKKRDVKRLGALGLTIDGEFTVKTDGKVIEHNADSQGGVFGLMEGYEWKIDSLSQPAPKIVIEIEGLGSE